MNKKELYTSSDGITLEVLNDYRFLLFWRRFKCLIYDVGNRDKAKHSTLSKSQVWGWIIICKSDD